MKDVAGVNLKEGDFVIVKVGTEWVPATVHKTTGGGLLVGSNQQTLERLLVIFEFQMADALPGQNHPTVRRVPHPEYERVVPKAN